MLLCNMQLNATSDLWKCQLRLDLVSKNALTDWWQKYLSFKTKILMKKRKTQKYQ